MAIEVVAGVDGAENGGGPHEGESWRQGKLPPVVGDGVPDHEGVL